MTFDLLRPVPAAAAPAFWTKKTSSVGGYLVDASGRSSTKTWEGKNIPNDRFVKQWVAPSTRDYGQSGIVADDIVESLVVDVEWLRKSIILTQARRQEYLHTVSFPCLPMFPGPSLYRSEVRNRRRWNAL